VDGEQIEQVRQVLARLLGDQCKLLGSLAEAVEHQRLLDSHDTSVVFAATESEKLLVEAFQQLSRTLLEPAPQPLTVKTLLKFHQRQGLNWMLQRELAPPTLPPFWKAVHRFGDHVWHPRHAASWGLAHMRRAMAFLLAVRLSSFSLCLSLSCPVRQLIPQCVLSAQQLHLCILSFLSLSVLNSGVSLQ
jgi:hypothetical protein